jgi:hypothetical protein
MMTMIIMTIDMMIGAIRDEVIHLVDVLHRVGVPIQAIVGGVIAEAKAVTAPPAHTAGAKLKKKPA